MPNKEIKVDGCQKGFLLLDFLLMILADKDIKVAISQGRIEITPKIDFAAQLGSCSIDLRLGNTFRIFNYSKFAFIDPFKDGGKEITKEIVVGPKEQFILQPQDFVLATTIEYFELADDLLARLEGRSSLGRLGIVVHSTSAIFDPGWRGKVVMELGNLGRMPVALYPGMRICSLTFEELSSPAETPYYKKKGAKYLGQKGPEPSKFVREKK